MDFIIIYLSNVKEYILGFSIVDILSMGASISTMIGLFIAIVSLWNYYREKREKLEYEVKKDFIEGKKWEFSGWDDSNSATSWEPCNEGERLIDFDLTIGDDRFFKISGSIEYPKSRDAEVFNIEDLLFYKVIKSYKKEIIIEIHQLKEIFLKHEPSIAIDLRKEILGTATLEHITPHEFRITFNKNCLPDFPRIASLTTDVYYEKRREEMRNEEAEKAH